MTDGEGRRRRRRGEDGRGRSVKTVRSEKGSGGLKSRVVGGEAGSLAVEAEQKRRE